MAEEMADDLPPLADRLRDIIPMLRRAPINFPAGVYETLLEAAAVVGGQISNGDKTDG